MKIRRVATSAAAMLGLFSGMLVVVPAGAEGPLSVMPRSKTNRQSGTMASQVLAAGQVMSDAHDPVAGATVDLYAWPSNDVTEKMGVGDSANLQSVASTVSAADGSFSLRVVVNSSLASLAGVDKVVNFTIFAVRGDSVADFNFARTLDVVDGQYVLSEVGAGQPEIAAGQLDLELTLDGSSKVRGPEESGAADYSDLTVVDESAPFQKGCTGRIIGDYGKQWAIVGQHYSITDLTTTDFTYSRASSSALGVATSVSGNYGTFTVSGTAAKSSSGTIGFPTAGSYAKQVRRTTFRYVKWWYGCIGQGGASYVRYQVRPHAWTGGAQTLSGRWYPFANHCASYEPRSWFLKDRTLAFEWSNGVDIARFIGLNLSSRTGYSSMTSLTFRNVARYTPKLLCGLYADVTSNTRAARMMLWRDDLSLH